MEIYIASSWKNQHAVEMLTDALRAMGHKVLSFVENNNGEKPGAKTLNGKPVDVDTWVRSEEGERSFWYDTEGATKSDLTVYVGPSGKDAAAEVGAAWASKRPIYGLYAKGEDFGLMRRMMDLWFHNYRDLLEAVHRLDVARRREKRARRKPSLRKV